MANSPSKITESVLILPTEAHSMPVEDVIRYLDTPPVGGLTTAEAQRRLAEVGPNELQRYRSKSLMVLFLEQFKNPLAWVLTVAALLAFGFNEDLEGIAILLVILINAIIGFVMEWQAIISITQTRAWIRHLRQRPGPAAITPKVQCRKRRPVEADKRSGTLK